MKGIVLAGGAGTRLHPLTQVLSKQLLPVYDKPMIYYPISLLMLADIREILIISTPHDLPQFQSLLGDGSRFGIRLSYEVQPKPEGLPQAFIIGERFLAGEASTLILGDNIFYGQNLPELLRQHRDSLIGGVIYATKVAHPERYGVVEFDAARKPLSLEEKPSVPKSPYAVTGVYMFAADAPEEAKKLTPGRRGELEILGLADRYLERNALSLELLGRGTAWFDTGTHQSLLDAANFIATIQDRQGLYVACLEEIAYEKRWIDGAALCQAADASGKSSYGDYLRRLAYG